jgi:uncharacterized protein YlaI
MIGKAPLKKQCADCGKSISFQKFLTDNPSFSKMRAKELWNDPMISIFCPECYFNISEKPFKIKRGYFNYQNKFRR